MSITSIRKTAMRKVLPTLPFILLALALTGADSQPPAAMVAKSMPKEKNPKNALVNLLAALAPAFILAVLIAGCGANPFIGGCSFYVTAGCGSSGTAPPPPPPQDCSATVSGSGQVGINASDTSCDDATYGEIEGYTVSGTSSQVIKAPAGSNIVFVNNDASLKHTADFLTSSLPFPASYPTGAQRPQSPAGTAINDPNFSTGTLAPAGGTSLVYKVPAVPGTITLIGCFFSYDGHNFRTAVIAQ